MFLELLPPLNPDDCYAALQKRDRQFDGVFVVAIRSTRIYCRPICRVRIPYARNCPFFHTPAQAEQQGFRPCLRCRPELAPEQRFWSMEDAAGVLLAAACVRWQRPSALTYKMSNDSVSEMAIYLGISERHLRRIFQHGLGVSPQQYLQTQRLLHAKRLLTDTSWSVIEIANSFGFNSIRRFNEAFKQHYRLSPSSFRGDKMPEKSSSIAK
jgi:AraC family transcriptional regulator of adaptative response / DNA-3-methyladenine glycosylase II